MIIQKSFDTLPPKPFLMQILDNTSKTYIFLWERKDEINRIILQWKDLRKYHHINTFRSCIRKLNDKGLLSYEESDTEISIELITLEDLE